MADQAHVNQTRINDANGDPVPGALVNVYATGTLARIDVWLDSDATTLATNPVVADANGAVPQLFVEEPANIIVTTALGATLYALDPAPLSPTTGSGAAQVSFAPTANVPFTNAQDAIVGLDASLRALIMMGGTGVTADAPLLASLDATATAGGVYRFSAAATGTFPTGVVAADTGSVVLTRQSATQGVMELYALGREFRRTLSTTWGAWVEVATVTQVDAVTTYVNSIALGVGQTWQDVSGARVTNTSYRNLTGKPIGWSIRGDANLGGSVQVSVNNSTWVTIATQSDWDRGTFGCIVPNNHYYRFTGSIGIWCELRA